MRVVFRADATLQVGTGHIMRCWALAEEFQAQGWEVNWQGTIAVPWLSKSLARAGWHIEVPQEINVDLVVIDSYTLDSAYRQRLLDRRIPVVAIVDSHHRELGPGSLWVNPGVPMSMSKDQSFLNGPDYALIRVEIRDLRQLRRAKASREGVTFLLGGTDFAELGSRVDRLRLRVPAFAGPGAGSSPTVEWLPGGAELLKRAACSLLVVSAAGLSSWEMLHVGVPLALVLAADNQRGNYDWLTSQKWAKGLGSGPSLESSLTETLLEIENDTFRGFERIDGLGAKRVCDEILRRL